MTVQIYWNGYLSTQTRKTGLRVLGMLSKLAWEASRVHLANNDAAGADTAFARALARTERLPAAAWRELLAVEARYVASADGLSPRRGCYAAQW